MAAIDRRKHDIDVMERVLGGVRDGQIDSPVWAQVVDIDARPWLGEAGTSIVQFTVSHDPKPGDGPRPSDTDRPDPYESDRRGEHQYPDSEEVDEERPSQREHEALKERLERRH